MRALDYRWVIVAVGFTVLFFSNGSRAAFGLMLKPMSEDLDVSRSSLSLAVTAFMVVSALAMPLVGRLADRHSLRWIIATAALTAAVGIGLMGQAEARWHIFVLYGLVYAVGHAGVATGPIGVMISRWFVRRRGIANSIAISGTGMGQLVIITLLASFVKTLGWRTSYSILGIVNAAVVVPLVLAGVRSNPRSQFAGAQDNGDGVVVGSVESLGTVTEPAADELSAALSQVLVSRQFWLLITLYAACGFQDFFMATHVVAFALDQGVGSVLAGNILALMGLTGLIGVLSSGALADAFGAARPTVICFLIRIALFVFVIYFQDTVSIAAFALLYGFTFLITAPLTIVFASNIFGAARLGTVSGLITAVHQVSGGIGAFVGAAIFDRWGSYDGAFVLMLGLAVLAFGATLMVRERPIARAATSS